jgi:hypothetical protein
MRRSKILMGVLAVALPIGTLAATQTAAVAKKAPPNPINCTISGGGITFGDALTKDGNALVGVKKGGAGQTSVSSIGLSCTGGKTGTSPTLNVASTGSNTQVQKKPTKEYVIGTWTEFTSSSGSLKKALKSITFTIAGSPNTWKTKGGGLTFTGCPGEIGYALNGQVAGTYDTKTATILVCLGTTHRADATTGSFLTDYNSYVGNPAGTAPGNAGGGVASVDFDAADSTVTL